MVGVIDGVLVGVFVGVTDAFGVGDGGIDEQLIISVI